MKKLITVFALLLALQYDCDANDVKVNISIYNGEEKTSRMLIINEEGDTLDDMRISTHYKTIDINPGTYYKFVFINGDSTKTVEILKKDDEQEFYTYHYRLDINWSMSYNNIKL